MTNANKEKYREFYKSHPDICVFSAPWWLDAVAGDSWDVILIEEGESIIASFPYVYTKGRLGIKKIEMPPLTQKLGPYLVYKENMSYSHKIEYEHSLYQKIIDNLPYYDEFHINFDQCYKNWLSFYWSDFTQSTLYSYRLEKITDYETLFKNFAKYKRQKIKKGESLFTVRYDLSANDFYDYFLSAIKIRNDIVGFSFELFTSIYNAVYAANQGRVFYCIDLEDKIHAVALIVWDNTAAYYLIGMRKPEYANSGGTEFLIYEMIKYVSQFVDIFDFEGSMIQGVEQSFRYYGTQQTEYYSISKVNNKLLKLYRALHI